MAIIADIRYAVSNKTDEIKTHYIKGGFDTAGEVVLSQIKTTRTIFKLAVGGLTTYITDDVLSNASFTKVSEQPFLPKPYAGIRNEMLNGMVASCACQ